MKVDAATARQTVNYLRRSIPKGQNEADELIKLIRFYEQASRQKDHRRH